MYGLASFVITVDAFLFFVLTNSRVNGIVLQNGSSIDTDRMDGSNVQKESGFTSLSNSKNFQYAENVGEGKSFGGKWLLNEIGSKIASVMSSTGGIRAVELLEQVKTKVLERIKSSAVDVVKSREGGWHGWGWGSGGGGIHSLEGALLSLAFLTFAVFLINLIQQFVALFRTGTQIPLLGRRRRNAQPFSPWRRDADALREPSTLTSTVLTSIEKPLFSKQYNFM